MKKTSTLVAAVLLASFSFAQKFTLLTSNDDIMTINHDFSELTPQTTDLNGVQYYNFDKTYKITMKEEGAPALPTFAESLIIPNEGSATLVIEHDGYTDYSNISILPSKGSLKRNIDPSQVPYTFGTEYSTNAFFPSAIAEMGEPYHLRNTRGITIRISPYQYNPVTKTLRVYKNIQASVVMNSNESGLNELTPTAGKEGVFNQVYNNHYINAEAALGKYTPVEEDGDMLVIATDGHMDEIQPLVDWKIQEGIRTTLVSTTTTGSTDTQIKSYIDNFYASNPDLVYILLVGDHGGVPSHTYGSSGWEQLWSDSYYGQLSGGSNDYYPEVFVGRLSGTSSGQITTQVDRILEYEKDPAAGTWMENAIGLASDEGAGIGNDGEADWQHARNIRTLLQNYGYGTVYEFYDGSHGGDDASGNPTPTMVTNAVNSGVGLFNYTGHGDQNTCITGNFGSTQINSATNNGMYPFVISVACNNGTFTSGTCLSETFAWATNGGSPTGAIASCGSTILMAWAEPMQTQDEMAEIITEAYANNYKTTLGGLFYNSQMSVLEEYNSSSTAREVMQTWVMFGDPSTMYRNKQTMNMDVSHIGNVPLGTSSVVINCDTDDAKITIVQDGAILGTELAAGGSATISFTALTSNSPLIVTAVKQNYDPYQGVITVADGPAGINEEMFAQLAVYPNPADDVLNINWNEGLNVEAIQLFDLSGKVIAEANPTGTATSIETTSIATGMYVLRVSANGTTKTTKVAIK